MAGGKRGQACEPLGEGTSPASLCPPACRFTPPSLEYHAHMSTIYTDIFYILSLYKYIYVHIYRVYLQAWKPQSRPAVGGQEESWSCLLLGSSLDAGRNPTTAQEDGARW